MPFKPLDKDSWVKSLSRTLISGPPNTRKTTSLLTWPRPIHILVYPNEGGAASIPAEEEGVFAYVFEENELEKSQPGLVVKQVEDLTLDILTGKKGEVATFAGDGLHKFYDFYKEREFKSLVASNPTQSEEKLIGRAYGNAHNEFLHYLGLVKRSSVGNVVFTLWDGKEKDDPDNTSAKAPTHIYPDLPGQLAKRVMGEFSVVLYAILTPEGHSQAKWQIQPTGKVWGAAVKVPPHIAVDLPQEFQQNWAELLPVLKGEKKVNRLLAPPKPQMPTPIKK